jgi:hypothetical protein
VVALQRDASKDLELDGVLGREEMAMALQKREDGYRRYAIVDQAMIGEAASKMDREAKVRRTTAQRTAQSDQTTADR